MKVRSNKHYNTVAFYAILVIAASMLMVIAIFKFSEIKSAFQQLMSILSPIFLGIVIAFILNPLVNSIEKFANRFVMKKQHPKLLRAVSVAISAVAFIAFVGGTLYIIIPAFADSISDMVNNISNIVNRLYDWSSKLLSDNPKLESVVNSKIDDLSSDLNSLVDRVQPMLGNVLSGALGFINFIKNFIFGFIVSIYILISKETLLAQFKKLFLATFKKKTCDRVFTIAKQSNKVFAGFLFGKVIDSVIIGILAFLGLWILGIEYYVLIAVIIGITNVIPYFGPFIGGIPSAILVLLVQPHKTIWFIIFILVLQQFDGNILGPKILGGTVGLPTFWVLFSLVLGGGLFGPVGLLLAVPTFSVLYDITRTRTENKLREKKLPTDTEEYKKNIEELYCSPKKVMPLSLEELNAIEIPPADEVNEVNS